MARLYVFAKLYDTTKGERNKCINLLQFATQRMTKMREKFNILKNEIEILHSETIKKDRFGNISSILNNGSKVI